MSTRQSPWEKTLILSRNSPVPLYCQLKDILKAAIECGKLKPNDRLPPETELAQRFQVSRMTVRQALIELENEGFIRRRQGRGTFVAEPKFRQSLLRLTSFTEDMQARGLKPGGRVLSIKVILGDKDLMQRFRATPDERFVRLERIRLADGEPMALEISFLRRKFCPGIEEIDFTDQSLYAILHEQFGLELGWASQTIEAKLANEYEAKLLGVQVGSPMLLMQRITYLADSLTPIEYVRSSYRGDRYQLYVEVKR